MATSNRSGPRSAANPPQERPREGDSLTALLLAALRAADQALAHASVKDAAVDPAHEQVIAALAAAERLAAPSADAEAGIRWWNALTEPQRAAAFAAAKTAVSAEAWAHAKAAGAPAHAETLTDIASEIRAWGSVGLFGAAERLEALAQALVIPAATSGAAPQAWAPDAERLALALESAWQLEGSLDLIIDSPELTQAETLGVLSVAIRCRQLACAVMSALDDEAADLDDVHRTVHGTFRATEGAAS